MKILGYLVLAGCLEASRLYAVAQPAPQPFAKEPTLSHAAAAHLSPPHTKGELIARREDLEQRDDPGHAIYREGYNLILDEQWQEARKKFADLKARYPGSEYLDDASYWSAYAIMHQDQKKAVDAYKQFMKAYPKSNYYDDAVADLTQLQLDAFTAVPESVATHTAGRAMKAYIESYSTGPQMREVERELRRAGRYFSRLPITPHLNLRIPRPPRDEENLDPDTHLKIEALYALTDAKEDEASFLTLKKIALDAKKPRQLREAALDALLNFKKYDILPVLVEVARKDTNEEIQAYAIDFIGQSKDKNRSVTLLVGLFNSLPKQRKEPIQTLFYNIAEAGNDTAVGFLKSVALTHDNYDLRREAVYYLGNIGGEKARGALYEILTGKEEDKP